MRRAANLACEGLRGARFVVLPERDTLHEIRTTGCEGNPRIQRRLCLIMMIMRRVEGHIVRVNVTHVDMKDKEAALDWLRVASE